MSEIVETRLTRTITKLLNLWCAASILACVTVGITEAIIGRWGWAAAFLALGVGNIVALAMPARKRN